MSIAKFLSWIFKKEEEEEPSDLVAENCMLERLDIKPIYENSTKEEIAEAFQDSGLEAIPICGQSLDEVIGSYTMKNFYEQLISETVDPIKQKGEIAFAAPNTNLSTLLKMIYSQEVPLVIVVDEFGQTYGVVTGKTILGALFYKYVKDFSEETQLDAGLSVSYLKPFIKRETMENVESRTISGFLMEYLHLRELPTIGQVFNIDFGQFTVLELDERSISKVSLKKIRS